MSKKYMIDTITLLSAATGTGSSEWFNISALDEKSVDVRISNTATVQVMLSNEPTKPASSSDGPEQGSDVTATGIVQFSGAAKWLKVKVSAYTSGTVTAYMTGNLFRHARID